ncbi:MAG: hypothetical protein ACXVAN_01000, partial [Polyangia bacterium]
MSAKKNCAACGKQIPDVAVVCVFCSATQPSADPELAAAADAATQDVVSKHATDPTLIGIKASDVAAALQDKLDSAPATVETGSNGASAAHPATTLEALTEATDGGIPEPTVEAPTTTQRLPIIEAEPWGGLGRLIMGIGGGVLIALFFCPWHGASSWQLLETLAGADFVRQLFYLTGGIVLLACALLPLPFVFRAAVGTAVAAMPVLLGAGGVIEGWRGVVASLAILGLPAT